MPTNTEAHIMATPSIVVGGVTLECASRTVKLTPSDSEVDVATFCDPQGTKPGATAWTLETEVLLNYDSADAEGDGTWNQFQPLAKTNQTFTVSPASGATDTTNPQATGTVRLPSIPFIDGAPGDKMIMTLVCPVVGTPTFATA